MALPNILNGQLWNVFSSHFQNQQNFIIFQPEREILPKPLITLLIGAI